MNVWRLITHHAEQDRALAWIRYSRHIAIGWGKIGDIGKQGYRSPPEIAVAISRYYPRDRSPAVAEACGVSLKKCKKMI